ncbi:hypothetical protein [Aquicoccus sp. SU-CL01552]|uniref:hypothetical protein n=1 Tax=Aquicoccus sp. SU-CL01552 TaxID=3127656 RepID=UPI0031098AB6
MIAPPLIVYLDTQDYIRIFNEPDGGPAKAILDQLLVFRDRGDIVIGYSWAIMLEFITRPTDDFREERVRRGQLVKNICGRNAFPFFTDLKRGARFPNNGIWVTGRDGKLMTANWFRRQMEKQYLETLAEQQGLNRAQRRRLKTPSAMRQLLRENTSTWGTKREDFKGVPVSDELIRSGVLTRFLKGRCSDDEFEERVNRWFSDPAEFSRIAYDYADKPNLLDEFFGSSINKMEDALRQIQEASRNFDDLGKTIRGRRQSLIDVGVDTRTARRLTTPPQWPRLNPSDVACKIEGHIGEGRAGHIGHYLLKASQKHYNFKRSDFIDIMQMCYVPDCDLFRCDKAMADLYRDYEPFAGKLVAKFTDLPARIEAQLCERGE